ncbi:hypothetical protein Y1Q_0001989 [Alligator mississippiensis]|uniref:Uncharacterized protein n=1 Tax=Alligator mississippiensis TaxID=8496 RepID=A0A151MCJ5_ALLMI|nr:hypothetical protein Y1Q_0001989 [Alligator mississippiensis]
MPTRGRGTRQLRGWKGLDVHAALREELVPASERRLLHPGGGKQGRSLHWQSQGCWAMGPKCWRLLHHVCPGRRQPEHEMAPRGCPLQQERQRMRMHGVSRSTGKACRARCSGQRSSSRCQISSWRRGCLESSPCTSAGCSREATGTAAPHAWL